MTCPHCHNDVADDATCPVCGQPLKASTELQKKPNSYIVWAVLSAFFCNTIFGICAIGTSIRVYTLLSRGDYEGAQRSSNTTKILCIISNVVGFIVWIWLLANKNGGSGY